LYVIDGLDISVWHQLSTDEVRQDIQYSAGGADGQCKPAEARPSRVDGYAHGRPARC